MKLGSYNSGKKKIKRTKLMVNTLTHELVNVSVHKKDPKNHKRL